MGAALITAAEVARLLGIKARTVYDIAYSGRLTCYRIGGAVRFDPVDVEAFKQSCRVDARHPTPQRPSRAGVNLTGLLADPHTDLLRFFESRGVRVRAAPVTAAKGNKKGNAGR